mmetsp:Transcript_22923/g.46669  ORF Transcript_22923/g.46669 Transcript_22923/m.46669 type:complete len:82 (+) Transcript_22923:360-605(+)
MSAKNPFVIHTDRDMEECQHQYMAYHGHKPCQFSSSRSIGTGRVRRYHTILYIVVRDSTQITEFDDDTAQVSTKRCLSAKQ